MAILIRNIITKKGKDLINSVVSGKNKLVYTTAELYAKNISTLTDDQVKSLGLSDMGKSLLSGEIKVTDYNDTSITISAEFANGSLLNDIAFSTVGWYGTTTIDKAQDTPPILLGISQLDSEAHLVAGNENKTTSFFIPRVIMGVSDTQNVELQTGEVGFVTMPELEQKIFDLANKGLIDFGQKFENSYDIGNLHNTSLHYVGKGSVIGLPETSKDEPKDLGGYLISLGKGDVTQDGVRIYFNPFSEKTFISYYLNKENTWTEWFEVGNKSYTKEEIDRLLEKYNEKIAKTVQKINGNFPDDTGNINLVDYDHPTREFNPSETFDIDFLITPGIYKITNARITCSLRKDALEGIPYLFGDRFCGYLRVIYHTPNYIEQILLLNTNSGSDTPDVVVATRSISNSAKDVKPKFRRLLNIDDKGIDAKEHYYSRSVVVDDNQINIDESKNSLIPKDVLSQTSIRSRISLNNLIGVYTEGSRVINDIVSSELPNVYLASWKYQQTPTSPLGDPDYIFNSHTQRIRYLVQPIISSGIYDTYQKVTSGGFIFERYHKKTFDIADTKKGWTNWNFAGGYSTGIGERPFSDLVNTTVNKDSGSTRYDTIGVDNPPNIPGYADLNMLNGIYDENISHAMFPPGIYVRRPNSTRSVDIHLPRSDNGIDDFNCIIEVKVVPFIFGKGNDADCDDSNGGKGVKRQIAHCVQNVYGMPQVLTKNQKFWETKSFQRQGRIFIGQYKNNLGVNAPTDIGNYTTVFDQWHVFY